MTRASIRVCMLKETRQSPTEDSTCEALVMISAES